jgi:hypothetical protein
LGGSIGLLRSRSEADAECFGARDSGKGMRAHEASFLDLAQGKKQFRDPKGGLVSAMSSGSPQNRQTA